MLEFCIFWLTVEEVQIWAGSYSRCLFPPGCIIKTTNRFPKTFFWPYNLLALGGSLCSLFNHLKTSQNICSWSKFLNLFVCIARTEELNFLFIFYLMDLATIFLLDPRGAGHVEVFQFLSVCLCVSMCLSVSPLNFKTSHWPSAHMISSRLLIG